MKNVLIVGGCGYIGGAITDHLSGMGYNVRVYDSLVYEEVFFKPVDFVYGDIREHNKLKEQFEWADTVVWLAAIVGDGACALNPDLTYEINQNSVKWLSENFDGRIVFMSTCSVYGAQNDVLNEQSPVNPLSVYASTKYEAEQYLKDKNAIIFRLGTLFGKGDNYSRIRMDLVVNILAVRSALENKMRVFGGDQFRPLLHVRDVAKGVAQNIDTEHTGVYNLHRQNVRIIDLAYQVRNHFPDCEIEVTDTHFQDTRNYRVSSDKAINTFGWDPTVTIDTGIEELKELITTRRIKDVYNNRFNNAAFMRQVLSIG